MQNDGSKSVPGLDHLFLRTRSTNEEKTNFSLRLLFQDLLTLNFFVGSV